MMKKTILFLVVLALLVPAAAFAATEFSLGGFIKLDSFWDSTQQDKNMAITGQLRNNDQLFHHGRYNMTAQGSRFNFTIKGPKLWGANTTGFIEMDFDSQVDARMTSSYSYVPRLRHAMFRLNWPTTELLFGQYWAFNNEFFPETVQDAGLQNHGTSTHRPPQIRVTQKFMDGFTVAGMIARPYDSNPANDQVFATSTTAVVPAAPAPGAGVVGVNTLGSQGQSSETPQLQMKLGYEKDLWGKAPFYGRPRGFTAQVMGAWQRTRYRSGDNAIGAWGTWGQNCFANFAAAATVTQQQQQYLDPWVIQGNLFLPVLPTYSNNLAGSASLSVQWYVGQGLSAFGNMRDQDTSFLNFKGIGVNAAGAQRQFYDRELVKAFGGYVQGQYWFTNEWFMNVVWGMQRNYGHETGISGILAGQVAANPLGYKYAANSDQIKLWNEIDVALYYRPIAAMKFGLQYAYARTDWLQKVNNPQSPAIGAQGQGASGATNVGESHRVEFGAWLFF